jgi:hypothetical protein
MLRTIVLLSFLFGLLFVGHAQATCEENRYVNVSNLGIRVVGPENEAIKSLPVQLHMIVAESKELQMVPVAIAFDEATYQYVIPRQIVKVPNTVGSDQSICSQTPRSLSIVVENYKPLKNLEVVEANGFYSLIPQRFTIEVNLSEAERIIKPEVAQAF